MRSEASLRDRVLRGGMYLAARQGLGLALHVGGVILLTRAIGPENYGLYAAGLAIATYLFELSQWGVGVYLVRRAGELDVGVLRQASTLLLVLGAVGVAAAQALVPALTGWIGMEGLGPVARVLIAGLPVMLLAAVPLAALERALDYRRVAWIELGALVLFYAVALSFALAGYGAWAPVLGWWAQQLALLVALHVFARYRPGPAWDREQARRMISYGLSFSASMWIWQLRNLVNPLIVGRVLGAEAVGLIALTHQLVRNLGFVMTATWRLSTAALARVQDDARRLVRAVGEGMQLQTLAVGPPLVAFAWLAPFIIAPVFGEEWSGVAVVFPFLALGYLTNALFNLHSSALYVREWNWDVALFHAAHIALFAGFALLLVGRVGIVGYGLAELAALPSYAVIHAAVRRRYGAPRYAGAALWWAAFALALFPRSLGWWVAAAPALAAALPSSRRIIGEQVRLLWGAVHG